MIKYEYIPSKVCSSKMIFEIDNNIVKNLKVIGGCPGNSLGIINLIKNMDIDQIIRILKGIKCGIKNTSCPDQIALALIEYKNKRDN